MIIAGDTVYLAGYGTTGSKPIEKMTFLGSTTYNDGIRQSVRLSDNNGCESFYPAEMMFKTADAANAYLEACESALQQKAENCRVAFVAAKKRLEHYKQWRRSDETCVS
jgi:hypothetical protein